MSKPKTLIHQAKDILDQFCYAITERATKQADAERLFNIRQQEIEADFARSQKQIEEAFVAEKARIEVEHLDRQRVVRDRLETTQSSIKRETRQKETAVGTSFTEWTNQFFSDSSFRSICFQFWSIWCSIGLLGGIVVSLIAMPWTGGKYFLFSLLWLMLAVIIPLVRKGLKEDFIANIKSVGSVGFLGVWKELKEKLIANVKMVGSVGFWGVWKELKEELIASVKMIGSIGFLVNIVLSLLFKEWLAVIGSVIWCLGGIAAFLPYLKNLAEQNFAEIHKESRQKLNDSENLCQRELSSLEPERTQKLNKAKDKYSNQLSSAESAKRGDFSDVQNNYQRNLRKVQDDFETWMSAVKGYLADLLRQVNQLSPPWTDTIWHQWTTPATLPPVVRFGLLRKNLNGYSLVIPALLPFPSPKSLLINVIDQEKPKAVAVMQSLLLRLLANLPPGKISFIFIDPVGLGANVAPFMHLSDYDEKLIRDQVWVKEQDIKQRLVELTDHIALVHQKYLRNQYATIEEYNRDAGEIAEPYRFLVVVDFPVNFSAEAGRCLISIIQKGPQCGVYSIILNDFSKPLPPASSFNINDFYQAMRVLTVKKGGVEMEWPEADFKDCSLELENPPDKDIFNRLVNQLGEGAKNGSKVEVPFDKVLERANLNPDQWWQGNTIDGIQVPMGPSGARKIQHLEIGQGTAQHVLMIGMTSSGKTTLFHVLITTLALKYSPDELELYLIDFKKGVEFKVYATSQLPHARVIAIESEREFGLSVLEGLDAELKRRGDMFRQAMAQNLASYRRNTQYSLPRILLLVDEFQEFFSEEDTLASKVTQILDRLVRQGRALGIHILMGSQTLATSGIHTLKRGIIDQMGIRIALQCGDQDSRTILDVNNDAAKLLSRSGEAIYNAKNGLVEGNNPFQVAWLPIELLRQYLHEIEKLARQTGHYPPKSQVVFEGNAPANMETHHGLNELLTHPRLMTSTSLLAWLGEPIALKEVTATQFRRQSENNLLIVGQNEEAALSTLLASVLTLSAYQAPQTAKFYILDCFNPIDSTNAYWFTQLSNSSRQQIKVGLPRQLPEMFKEIVMEMNLRLEKIKTHSSLSDQSTVYLIIYGLQRARDLEFDNSPSKLNEPLTPAKQLVQILHEGPDLGIHSLVWCDTVSNFKRRVGQQAQVLREFGMRVLFQMSEEDSNFLMGNKLAGKLGQHRALLYDHGNNQMEKFRPFALPSLEWLNRVLGRPSQQTESSRGGEAENIFWGSKGR